MESTDLKRWKTGFTDWYDNFRSAACQQIKIYSDLKYRCLNSSSGPYEIFLYEEDALMMKKGTITTTAQENIRSELTIYATEKNREEQHWASMNSQKTLTGSMGSEGNMP